MVNALYTRLEATARRLIASYGKVAQFIVITNTGPKHNPTTGEEPHACKLVDIGWTLQVIPQSAVIAGDKSGLISTEGLTITVNPKMKIEIDGERYNFVALMPFNPGGLLLYYEFVARK